MKPACPDFEQLQITADAPATDLYGFELPESVQAQAIRLQCDGVAQRAER